MRYSCLRLYNSSEAKVVASSVADFPSGRLGSCLHSMSEGPKEAEASVKAKTFRESKV